MAIKALCVGCNYPRTSFALQGCVRDCHAHANFAREIGFSGSEIRVLADGPVPGFSKAPPTKQNILGAIKELVAGAESGDVLYVTFSGHGTQVSDKSSDERDGYDEAIVPGDYADTNRLITDDELHHYMVRPLAEGVQLICVFDSCHSGTVMDLPACLDGASMRGGRAGKQKYSRAKPCSDVGCRGIPPVMNYVRDKLPEPKAGPKANSKGQPTIFCFSGCRDDQFSYEVEMSGKKCGLLSTCFIEAASDADSYLDLFEKTAKKVIAWQPRQIPQMSYLDSARKDVTGFRMRKRADDEQAKKKRKVDESAESGFFNCAVQ